MQNIGLIVMGAITLLSMIMMIGNVASKSPYGKYWAMLGGSSLLLAGLLLALPHVMRASPAQAATQKTNKDLQTSQTNADLATDTNAQKTDAQKGTTKSASSDAGVAVPTDSTSPDLSFLVTVMDALKQGKPIPSEYLSLLPDGGQALKSAGLPVASSNTSHPLSHTLQTQIASMARSTGDPFLGANTYMPSHPNNISQPTYATSPNDSSGQGARGTSSGATANNGSTGNGSNTSGTQGPATTPAPSAPPASIPAPAPAPTTPAPYTDPGTVSDSPALISGQLLASVLGKSETEVNTYFQFNQPLGKVGNVISFIRGTAEVDVTMSGGVATQVKITYNRFTPQGQTMGFYADYLRSEAGLTKATPTSQSGSDMTWNGVYPGASHVVFHIDTSANYGYVLAQR